jgi:hypothetical protein
MNVDLSARKSKQTSTEFVQMAGPQTPDEWENRLIAKAYASVEERIDNGTASAAELTWFLRAGSIKHRQEIEKLREENALLRAKTSAIESEKEKGTLYREVINALGTYRTESFDEPADPYVY